MFVSGMWRWTEEWGFGGAERGLGRVLGGSGKVCVRFI